MKTLKKQTVVIEWVVEGESATYRVWRSASDWQCNCPDFLFRKHECKHIKFVKHEEVDKLINRREEILDIAHINIAEDSVVGHGAPDLLDEFMRVNKAIGECD